MTVEHELKQLILSRYGSIRQFTSTHNIPNSTLDSVLTRGVRKSNVSTIITLCRILDISADELADGRITPNAPPPTLESLVSGLKSQLLTKSITFEGKELTPEQLAHIIDNLDHITE
jgi:predicted transcriptional regulator